VRGRESVKNEVKLDKGCVEKKKTDAHEVTFQITGPYVAWLEYIGDREGRLA